MKRIRGAKLEKRRYRLKSGSGYHYIGADEYKPGDIVELADFQAEFIRDKLIPLDPEPEAKPDPEPTVRLLIVEADDGWDVVNEKTNIAINNTSISLEAAKKLAGPDAPVIHAPKVDPEPIKAVHKGAGRYAIVWEKSGEPVTDHLYGKEDALQLLKDIEDGTVMVEGLKGEAE